MLSGHCLLIYASMMQALQAFILIFRRLASLTAPMHVPRVTARSFSMWPGPQEVFFDAEHRSEVKKGIRGPKNDKNAKKVIFYYTYFTDILVLNIQMISQFFYKNYTCNLLWFRCVFRWRTQIWSQSRHQKSSKALIHGNMSKSPNLPISPYFIQITFQ